MRQRLFTQFQPKEYLLSDNYLKITGQKIGPPSKRVTLHQKGLNIKNAKIRRLDKRGATDYEIVRINHLPTFEQVRLHTKEIMYSGPYQIEVEYNLSPEKLSTLQKLGDKKPNRTLLPCIDEPEAWADAEVSFLD